MSRFSRSIIRALKDIDGELSLLDKLSDVWDNNILRRKFDAIYYPFKHFLVNLPIFIKMAWNWRSWDYGYTIEALAILLDEQAKTLKFDTIHQNAAKYSRRCFTAAGMLRSAYNTPMDKTITYLNNRNPCSFVGTSIHREMITDKRIYDGMYEVAHKRALVAEKKRKAEAWSYIHKHIEHFWS